MDDRLVSIPVKICLETGEMLSTCNVRLFNCCCLLVLLVEFKAVQAQGEDEAKYRYMSSRLGNR